MKEFFPSNSPEETPQAKARRLEREWKKRYEEIPAAKPLMFPSLEEGEGSPFEFPPVDLAINKESTEQITDEQNYTEVELRTSYLAAQLNRLRDDEKLYGDYETTFCVREPGSVHRIDKMIAEIDTENPWQPGKIEHLLLLAKLKPELFTNPVVALGSEENKKGLQNGIPCLENRNERVTYTNHPRAAGFSSHYRFLIVRKKS